MSKSSDDGCSGGAGCLGIIFLIWLIQVAWQVVVQFIVQIFALASPTVAQALPIVLYIFLGIFLGIPAILLLISLISGIVMACYNLPRTIAEARWREP